MAVDTENLNNPGVQWVDIAEEWSDQRIDNFLIRELKGVPKSRIYRILRRGEVRVNKGRVNPSYRLQTGDLVRIPPIRLADEPDKAAPSCSLRAELEKRVLFEDERLLVLNKPSGLAVHGGSGLSLGLIEALRTMRPQEKQLELVHRLDRETSGCLLIAKKRSMLRELHCALREQRVTKIYTALLKGELPKNWSVDQPLKKNVLSSGERLVRIDPTGKASFTRFKCVQQYEHCGLSEVRLGTGRTHQIRVHAASTGQFLAGDEKYGDKDFNAYLRTKGLKRLFLHASRLKLPPMDNFPPLEFVAPLDDGLVKVIEKLAT